MSEPSFFPPLYAAMVKLIGTILLVIGVALIIVDWAT